MLPTATATANAKTSLGAPKAPPSPHAKDYNGSVVVTHVIQDRETLTGIAAIYGFPAWQPIWIYNTEVEHTLGKDPNLIRRGVSIFIPRSKKGYDVFINKLNSLKLQLELEGDKLIYELEADWYRLQADKVLINFASDILTMGVGLAFKLSAAAKATLTANKTLGQAKIAARVAARAEGREWAVKYAAVRSRLVGEALDAHKKMRTANDAKKAFLVGKGVDAATKVGDNFAGEDSNLFKHGKNAYAARKIVKGLRGGMSALAALGDAAEILVDYMEPSTVAEGVLWLATGETTQTTFDKSRDGIKKSVAAQAVLLGERIDKFKRERALLYGR